MTEFYKNVHSQSSNEHGFNPVWFHIWPTKHDISETVDPQAPQEYRFAPVCFLYNVKMYKVHKNLVTA